MEVLSTQISDVKIFSPKKNGDHRGFFSETYHKQKFEKAGLEIDFVQDNHSLSVEAGTLRGLHFQIPPFAQAKLVRVVKGSIFDVAVDLRKNSPSFGKYISVILSAEKWNQLYIPVGFAHGFCTLEKNTEVCYKVSHYYSPAHERGVLWNDKTINIKWPDFESYILSKRDEEWPVLNNVSDFF